MGRDNWTEANLNRLLSTLESGSRPKGGVKGILNGVPSIGAEHLTDDSGFNFSNIRYIPESFANKMKRGILQLNDILIVKDGATTGKTSFVSKDFPFKFACINEHVYICRLFDFLYPKYVFHYLKSHEGQSQIMSTFHGGAQGGINSEFVEEVTIPLPPISEQKRIIDKLDAILPRVKNVKTRLEKIPAILKKFRQSVLAAAFSGKLTEDWRERNDLENYYPLSSIESICDNSFYGPRFSSDDYDKNGVPTIRTTDMDEYGNINITDDTPRIIVPENKIENFRIKKGDLLVTRTGSIGIMAVYNSDILAIPSAYLIRFRFNNKVSSKFVFFYLISLEGKSKLGLEVTAITQPNINAQKIRSIEIPLPPIEEQNEIVYRVEKLFALTNSLDDKYKKAMERVGKIEQAVLAKAFRGELVEADPNDEPAEELLKKILAEKAKLNSKTRKRKREI